MRMTLAVVSVSFILGALVGKVWFGDVSLETMRSMSQTKNEVSERNSNPTAPFQHTSSNTSINGEGHNAAVASNANISGEQKTTLSAEDILALYPPPHISDPHFYGSRTDAGEVREQRRKGMNELLESMRQSGVSAEQVEQMRASYEDAINENRLLDIDDYNKGIVATHVQQVADMESSLRFAGGSEQDIANSIEALSSSPEAIPTNTSAQTASLPHPDMRGQ